MKEEDSTLTPGPLPKGEGATQALTSALSQGEREIVKGAKAGSRRQAHPERNLRVVCVGDFGHLVLATRRGRSP